MRNIPVIISSVIALLSCGDDKPQPNLLKPSGEIFNYLPSDTQFSALYQSWRTKKNKTLGKILLSLHYTLTNRIHGLKSLKDSTGVGFNKGVSEIYQQHMGEAIIFSQSFLSKTRKKVSELF